MKKLIPILLSCALAFSFTGTAFAQEEPQPAADAVVALHAEEATQVGDGLLVVQATAEQPAAEQSATERPSGEQQADDQPVTEQSATERPSGEQQADDRLDADHLAADQPAATPEAAPQAEATEDAGFTVMAGQPTVIDWGDTATFNQDVVITAAGMTVGGVLKETGLNPGGYELTGTTAARTLKVESGVATTLIFNELNMQSRSDTSANNRNHLIDVSGATVAIELVGSNTLKSSHVYTNCINKNGEIGSLTLRDKTNGSLAITVSALHAGAITSEHNVVLPNSTASSFAHFTMESGIVEIDAGDSHNPAIGASCKGGSKVNGKRALDINITGGFLLAKGGRSCAGIGSGAGVPVDGIRISGGANVTAYGGMYSPGIGSGGTDQENFYADVEDMVDFSVKNIVITGGGTIVTAHGDAGGAANPIESNYISVPMPGIGCGKDYRGNSEDTRTLENVTAVPLAGYQGYVKYGTSPTDYAFSTASPETPFPDEEEFGEFLDGMDKEDEPVFFTQVYFGPLKDNNVIAGHAEVSANNYATLTGGEAFTADQVKAFTLPEGHTSSGAPFVRADFTIDPDDFAALNQAKTEGRVGDFPVTYRCMDPTEGEIEVTCTVSLRDGAGSADTGLACIAANDAVFKTGGTAFDPEDLKAFCDPKANNDKGLDVVDGALVIIDDDQVAAINAAKAAGKVGDFPLTFSYEDPVSGTVSCTVTISLRGDGTAMGDAAQLGANSAAATSGGAALTEDQAKDLTRALAKDSTASWLKNADIVIESGLGELNAAKAAGKTGDFPITYSYTDPDSGEKVTAAVTVNLRDNGSDATAFDRTNPTPTWAANNSTWYNKDYREKPLTAAEIIKAASFAAFDTNGNPVDPALLVPDADLLKAANDAIAKNADVDLPMKFTFVDPVTGETVEVTLTVTLIPYTDPGSDPDPDPKPDPKPDPDPDPNPNPNPNPGPDPAPNADPRPLDTGKTTPKTADESPAAPLAALCLAGCAGMLVAGTALRSRRKHGGE